MSQKSEAPHDGGASRNSCGGWFHDTPTSPARPEQALALHVHQFKPDACGEELTHRIALLKARDYAAVLLGNVVSHRAYDHAHDAHAIAGVFVFADVPTARLALALQYCRSMVAGASLADHLDQERIA